MSDKIGYLSPKTVISLTLTVLALWLISTAVQIVIGYDGQIWRGAIGLFLISWGIIQLLNRPQS